MSVKLKHLFLNFPVTSSLLHYNNHIIIIKLAIFKNIWQSYRYFFLFPAFWKWYIPFDCQDIKLILFSALGKSFDAHFRNDSKNKVRLKQLFPMAFKTFKIWTKSLSHQDLFHLKCSPQTKEATLPFVVVLST